MTGDSILTLSCPNRPGIVAAVATSLAACGGDIHEAHQFDDTATRRFFMRIRFGAVGDSFAEQDFRAAIAEVAARYGMDWRLVPVAHRPRVLILVSGFDHCLVDLLYRWRTGDLAIDIAGVASNHPRSRFGHADLAAVDFHHLPVTPDTRAAQEDALLALVEASGAELVVLARYMQVLSDRLAMALAGRCINIHHSFLPGFKGARPYHQAHARGVKIIGATAHYVTANLDEGPIIAQDVERIGHAHTPDELVARGRDIERRVLARAVALHVAGRVLLNGSKTVVFEV